MYQTENIMEWIKAGNPLVSCVLNEKRFHVFQVFHYHLQIDSWGWKKNHSKGCILRKLKTVFWEEISRDKFQGEYSFAEGCIGLLYIYIYVYSG